tara:strand:- start:11589 stop:11753 length:165 start_codon:yes stop_codon:yes gene_type:complete
MWWLEWDAYTWRNSEALRRAYCQDHFLPTGINSSQRTTKPKFRVKAIQLIVGNS